MGQQQLLLLVLGVVIVGLAVVVGIDAFNENESHTQYDLATGESVKVAAELLVWRSKPPALGGGLGDTYLESASFSDLGYIIRGTNQNQSQTTLHRRTLGGLTTSRPYVEVYPLSNTNLRVRTYLYGPHETCLIQSRRTLRGTTWAFTPIPSYAARPADCPGW